uniref:Uncharacterized protein n=1 Tax=Brassica oleracea var. oleracea TaxID=109376 RepID=A0A0D3BE40_BRAOL
MTLERPLRATYQGRSRSRATRWSDAPKSLSTIGPGATCPERRTEVARISHPFRSDLPKRHPEVQHLIVATAEEKIVKEADKIVEVKILKGDAPMAEKPVAKRANRKLKEVKLEDTTEVEQSPYDKLPFPQRVLTKAQKKVISKFRKDLSDIGVKLPEISETVSFKFGGGTKYLIMFALMIFH